jgi:CRISPR-associated protein Csm5
MPEPQYALFKVTASTLTPLHIGSGRELLNEYDYAIYNKQTWRIDDSALLDAQDVDDPALANRLGMIPPAQLLREPDFVPGSAFFRYVIQGTPRSSGEGAVLREQIKDSFDRPYLPGSSLKGALRTALGWYAWGQKKLKPEMTELGFRKEWAAQNYEHTLFGPTPNKDALRAIQVSDSAPLDAGRLLIVNASVLGGAGGMEKSIPVELEAIRPDTNFELTIKLDLALHSDWARQTGLNLPGLDWLLQLPAILQSRARQRVEQEVQWYTNQPTAKRVLGFYQQLAAARLEANQALIQLGWGTGWDGTTFGSRLRVDSLFMQQLITKFRLSRGQNPGGPFPKSRRSVVSFSVDPSGRRTATPIAPLGWMVLTFEPLVDIPAEWKRLVKPITVQSPAVPVSTVVPDSIPASTPVPPNKSTSAPAAPAIETAKPKPGVIRIFTGEPQPGDVFDGIVVDCEPNGKITLQLRGIDPDETGMAVIPPQNNPQKSKYSEKHSLRCQVERLQREKDGYYWVICSLV